MIRLIWMAGFFSAGIVIAGVTGSSILLLIPALAFIALAATLIDWDSVLEAKSINEPTDSLDEMWEDQINTTDEQIRSIARKLQPLESKARELEIKEQKDKVQNILASMSKRQKEIELNKQKQLAVEQEIIAFHSYGCYSIGCEVCYARDLES